MNFIAWLRCEWDRVAGFALAGVGGVLVVLGGLAARGAPTTIDSLSYIATAGLIGLFCLGLGVGLFLSADLRDEWHKLDRIEAAIRGEPHADAETVLDLVSRSGVDGADRTAGAVASGRFMSVLLLPLAVMTLGIRQASSSAEFATAGRGVWIAALGVGATGGLVALRTARMRTRVLRRHSDLLSRYSTAGTQPLGPAPRSDADDIVVWAADGLRHFHRRGCPALAGLAAVPLDRPDVGAELVPCGLCGVGR